MDSRVEILKFWRPRRAKNNPEQAGVPQFGGIRWIPGLRREEVAMLAGVSTGFYLHRTGAKHLHHPVVGQLDLAVDALQVPSDTGLTMTSSNPAPLPTRRCSCCPAGPPPNAPSRQR